MGTSKSDGGKEQRIESPEEPSVDYNAMYTAMNQMAALNAASSANTIAAMQAMQTEVPTSTYETVDWKKRADDLRAKIASDEKTLAASRKGRERTILTSPLTDEKVKITESVLTGK